MSVTAVFQSQNGGKISLTARVLSALGSLLSPAVDALLMSLSTVVMAINAVLLRWAKLI